MTEASKELVICRRRNTTQTEQELSEWITELLRQLHPRPDSPLQYRIGTQNVCKSAFVNVYGISLGKLKKCRKLALNGKTRIIHGATGGRSSEKTKKLWIDSWLQRWLRTNGDLLVNGYYVVPSFIQEKDVYKLMVKDWRSEHSDQSTDEKIPSTGKSTSTSASATTSSTGASNAAIVAMAANTTSVATVDAHAAAYAKSHVGSRSSRLFSSSSRNADSHEYY